MNAGLICQAGVAVPTHHCAKFDISVPRVPFLLPLAVPIYWFSLLSNALRESLKNKAVGALNPTHL